MMEADAVEKSGELSITSSAEGLWERFCNGDREALGVIYRGHIDGLYHYGMHFCRDSERVKDCLQDLFQTLWHDREQISSNVENIRYYLIASLRRRLLRSLEKSKRNYTETIFDSFDFELIPPREEVIIQGETYRQHLYQLHKGIATLSRRQREAIYLRFYQNLSYEETAKLMSMKVESVYNLISKAVGLLKNMFCLIFILFKINH
ncbi:MAG: sigma-70 family RNA polymerase sigma factor [Ginsengibacter sp.]